MESFSFPPSLLRPQLLDRFGDEHIGPEHVSTARSAWKKKLEDRKAAGVEDDHSTPWPRFVFSFSSAASRLFFVALSLLRHALIPIRGVFLYLRLVDGPKKKTRRWKEKSLRPGSNSSTSSLRFPPLDCWTSRTSRSRCTSSSRLATQNSHHLLLLLIFLYLGRLSSSRFAFSSPPLSPSLSLLLFVLLLFAHPSFLCTPAPVIA